MCLGCPDLEPIAMGNYTGNVTYNSIAEFICDDGYKVHGANMTKCGYNGLWAVSPPTCIPGRFQSF